MGPADYASLRGPRRLGDRLLEAGLIRRAQLDLALARQQAAVGGRRPLGRLLVELGFVAERDLARILSLHLGMPVAPFALGEADTRAVGALPPDLCRRHRVVPCRHFGGSLLVASAGALVPAAVAELEAAAGLPVVLYLAPETEVEQVLAERHGGAGAPVKAGAAAAPPGGGTTPARAGTSPPGGGPGAEDVVPAAPSARLRELARRLLELADGHDRLARVVAEAEEESRRLVEETLRLRGELDRLRAGADGPLAALAESVQRLGEPGPTRR